MSKLQASQVSVIVAAYNNFPWLRLCLEGLRLQSAKGFEIVIADDGSDANTVELLHQYIQNHPHMHIKHMWHADQGWRKNIALNNAVKESQGNYLLFIDADCIPAPDWISDHIKLSRPGAIIAGRRTTLAPFQSLAMEQLTALDPSW